MTISILFSLGLAISAYCQDASQGTSAVEQRIDRKFESLDHRMDELEKAVDDILWYQKVGDVADIDKVFIVGPPPARVSNPTAMGAKNPLKFWAYVFIPHKADRSKKYPLLVLPHGGVHTELHNLSYAHHPGADVAGVYRRCPGIPRQYGVWKKFL